MAVLPLRYVPDPVLREPTKRVKAVDSRIRKLIEDMIETMHANNGVGIAANQVGVSLRIAVIQRPDEDEEPIILINPEVVRREGERDVDEGCLSIPGYQGEVKRSTKVRVKAIDMEGNPFRIKAENDLLAQALEHETDHLDGKVYIDRLASRDKFWKLEPRQSPSDDEEEMEFTPAEVPQVD